MTADGISETVMDIFRRRGAQDAYWRLETYYVLLENDRKLGRLSDQKYQEARNHLDQIGHHLEMAIKGESIEVAT
jgi:hypothetical protein